MRGLQGFGGGGIVPLVQATMGDAVAPRERGKYQAYIGTVWVIAGVVGPVIGGYIADYLHWSVAFWINVPLGAAAAYMINRQLKRLPQNHRKHTLDMFGALLMMTSAIALLLALAWGGVRYPWLSSTIILLVCCSVALTLAFGYRLVHEPEPFLPLSVLANPVMRAGTAAASCAVAVSIGLTVFMPLYYESVHHLSAGQSGLALIPIAVMTTPGSVLSGRIMMRFERYKWFAMIGLVCATRCDRRTRGVAGGAAVDRDRRAVRVRHRHRHRVLDVDGEHPERGVALRGRHRDRRDELFSRADLRARRRHHGRDHPRRHWRGG